jgi:hypothetical protein
LITVSKGFLLFLCLVGCIVVLDDEGDDEGLLKNIPPPIYIYFKINIVMAQKLKKLATNLNTCPQCLEKVKSIDYTCFALLSTDPQNIYACCNDVELLFKTIPSHYIRFYAFNLKSQELEDILKQLLEKTNIHLVFYYTGHGVLHYDLSHLSLMPDHHEYISKILLHNTLKLNKRLNTYFTAIVDACCSGDIFCLDKYKEPNNSINISSCNKKQKAKYWTIKYDVKGGKSDDGNSYFTQNFLNNYIMFPHLSTKRIIEKTQPKLIPKQQTIHKAYTNDKLYTFLRPFFMIQTNSMLPSKPFFNIDDIKKTKFDDPFLDGQIKALAEEVLQLRELWIKLMRDDKNRALQFSLMKQRLLSQYTYTEIDEYLYTLSHHQKNPLPNNLHTKYLWQIKVEYDNIGYSINQHLQYEDDHAFVWKTINIC